MVNAYFLDTSALAKRYIPETGTDWILSITDAARGY
jgi:predicted nucleic acid-binding protein